MKIKTAELADKALNWVVAKCEGFDVDALDPTCMRDAWSIVGHGCQYSTNWSQAGTIIDREKIGLTYHPEWEVPNWGAWRTDGDDHQEVMGETPLIAAMRCYVASKLGAEVEIPDELVE